MEKKLRVGVVGCGEITQVAHLPLLQELPNFTVTALCDLSKNVLNYLGDLYHIEKKYIDYLDLVSDEEVDVVLVSNKDHAPVAIAALNNRKHVFTEKPMAFNLDEANQMIEAAENNQVKLMVGYMKRYDPAFEYALPLLKEMDDLQLIKIHDFAGDYTINDEIYDQVKGSDISTDILEELKQNDRQKMIRAIGEERADLVKAYSMLLYLCTHDTVLLHQTYGPPDEILFADVINGTTVFAVMQYGDSVRCVLEGGLLVKRRDWDEEFVAYGNTRKIQIEFPFPYVKNVQTIVRINEQDNLDPKANVEKKIMVSFDEAFKREWRHFYDCVVNDIEPSTSGREAIKDIELMINIIKSVKTRQQT